MTKIGMFTIGFGGGLGIGVGVTALVLAKHYKKKYEQWQADFVEARLDLERSRRIRDDAEKKEAKEAARTETKKPEPKKVETTYTTETARYSPEPDSKSEHHPMDKDGDDEDDEDEEAKYEGPTEPYKLNHDDILEALRMMEEDGKTIKEVAAHYGVSYQGLQIHIDKAIEERASGRKRPTKYNVPYVIDFDQYEEERLEYEKVDLEYYRGDGVIMYSDYDWDGNPQQLLEIGKYLGPKKNLYQDKEDENHRIYIRNDSERIDYRILCFKESYTE